MRKSVKIAVPALAAIAASFFVGACAGGGSSGGESSKAAAGTTAAPAVGGVEIPAPAPFEEPSRSPDVVETGGSAAGAATAPLPDATAFEPSLQQRVIQTATLSVTVPKGQFDDAFGRARSIVAGLGGFVTGSSSSQGPDQRLVRGQLVLRVPQQAYAQAMSQLSQLGKVQAQQETGQDVSAQYVDLTARRQHLQAVETQLLGFLKRTSTVSEALAVQNRLNTVQLQLEELSGQIRYLDGATSYATITLSVSERGVPVAATHPSSDHWSFGDAWHAAADGFEKVIGGLLVALVVAGPILVGLLILVVAGRRLVRRRSARGGQPSGPAPSPLG